MLASFIKFVLMVGISSFVAVMIVVGFDEYYQDLEARRRAKWKARQSREQHPSSGPRYE